MDFLSTFSSSLHYYGYHSIFWLQQKYETYSDIMLALSHLGNPRMAFLFYFPVVFYIIDRDYGKKLLWAAAISEWMNMILKWCMFGDRPYWWGPRHNMSDYELRQFPLTCETGPGMPSGHAMVSAATWFFIVKSLDKMMRSHLPSLVSPLCGPCLWLLYTSLLLCVAVSRVYIASHFPHQLILGILAGVATGVLVDRLPVSTYRLRHHLSLSALTLLSSAALYACLHWWRLEPDWSLPLARRHCVSASYVHVITQPFSSLARDVGAVAGLGLALTTTIYGESGRVRYRWAWLARLLPCLQLAVAGAAVLWLDGHMWAGETDWQFYVLKVVKSLVRSYIQAATVPYLVTGVARVVGGASSSQELAVAEKQD